MGRSWLEFIEHAIFWGLSKWIDSATFHMTRPKNHNCTDIYNHRASIASIQNTRSNIKSTHRPKSCRWCREHRGICYVVGITKGKGIPKHLWASRCAGRACRGGGGRGWASDLDGSWSIRDHRASCTIGGKASMTTQEEGYLNTRERN